MALNSFQGRECIKMTLTYFGCKVRQSVPIGNKFELDLWHHLPDVYTKCQIIFENSENKIFVKKIELVSRSIQRATYVPDLKNLSYHEAMLAKSKFDLIAVK